ncbi:MAG: DUF3006 domain-containing protein [Oscillospiraceae bacterium]|nr:DUF3006 domain-containing protein [Oscillospiraceae bacterium]
MKIYSVDRIENGFAVCEDKDTKKIENILIDKFDFTVKAGDILRFDGDKYSVDINETQKIKKELFDLQNSLFD